MLPKKNRLKLDRDFSKLFKTGHSNYGRFVGVKIKDNQLDYNRFSIIVSNKINKSAVKRNYIKRKVSTIIKELNKNCLNGFDCAIIVLLDVKKEDYKQVQKEIVEIFKKLNFIN